MEATFTAPRSPNIRRVLLSSYLGTSVEMYDFLVYGTAASLVFGQVFFSNLPPLAGVIASFATLALGYVARPIGGLIFGHYGDKIGRKRMLILSMFMMGAATFLIGCLPGRDQIGWIAPFLLLALRLIQGVAVGGEWGGATLMALEHSSQPRRGFSASIVNSGGPTGAVLAAGVLALFSLLPSDQFLAWGWRIPFLLSAVLVIVGLWVRSGVKESPVFVEELKRAEAEGQAGATRAPLREAFRKPRVLIAVGAVVLGALLLQVLLASFGLTFAVAGGISRTDVLLIQVVASIVNIFTVPLFGVISDRLGRRPVLIAGAVGTAIFAYPMVLMLGSGSIPLVFLAYLIAYALLLSAMFGAMNAFVTEQFPTSSRYSGASIGYQFAGAIAGFGPLVATAFLTLPGGADGRWVAALLALMALITAAVVFGTRETFRRSIQTPSPATENQSNLGEALV